MTKRWITVQLKLIDGIYSGDAPPPIIASASFANRDLVAPADVDLGVLGGEISRLLVEMVGTVARITEAPKQIVAKSPEAAAAKNVSPKVTR
jgi:hypothetical protein